MRYIILTLFITLSELLYSQDSIFPHFKGGDAKLFEFLAKNVKYPEMAMEQGIQGRVFLAFIVEENGSISNIKVISGVNGGCTEEAIRVVNLTQGMWQPAWVNGKPQRAEFHLPVKFTIREVKKEVDYYELGLKLMKEGKYRQAISFFSNYKNGDKVNVDALYNRGLCSFLLEEYENAIWDWEEAMKHGCIICQTKLNETYKCLGDKYSKKEKYKNAITWYTKYLVNLPNDIDVLLNRGKSYIKVKENTRACGDWQRAKELGSAEAQNLLDNHCNK
ncbi:MAG: TonB family protein [Bacteroidales bacterium]|nr:TonB family protein [Bacteroidales bacterium]MDD4604566.1 TonB family protein [Bacteroidales bacterium]